MRGMIRARLRKIRAYRIYLPKGGVAQRQGDISHMPTNFEIGDVVALRKAHPCGAREWRVVRVGADIGIVCAGCERRVTLARSALERRMRGLPRKQAR